MLVLTRKKNESLLIGKDIEVKILSIANNSVRIGIDAPKEIDIVRREIVMPAITELIGS